MCVLIFINCLHSIATARPVSGAGLQTGNHGPPYGGGDRGSSTTLGATHVFAVMQALHVVLSKGLAS